MPGSLHPPPSPRAGQGYQIRFTTTASGLGAGLSTVLSDVFGVAVGPTVSLVVVNQPSVVMGGHPFDVQPVVELQVCALLLGQRWPLFPPHKHTRCSAPPPPP